MEDPGIPLVGSAQGTFTSYAGTDNTGYSQSTTAQNPNEEFRGFEDKPLSSVKVRITKITSLLECHGISVCFTIIS